MNVVLDDAVEIYTKTSTRKPVGQLTTFLVLAFLYPHANPDNISIH